MGNPQLCGDSWCSAHKNECNKKAHCTHLCLVLYSKICSTYTSTASFVLILKYAHNTYPPLLPDTCTAVSVTSITCSCLCHQHRVQLSLSPASRAAVSVTSIVCSCLCHQHRVQVVKCYKVKFIKQQYKTNKI